MSKRGSSSIDFILMFTMIILFIMLPLFIFVMERMLVVVVIDEFKSNVDQSFLSVYQSLELENFSKGNLLINNQDFEDGFESLLDKNMQLDQNAILVGVDKISYTIVDDLLVNDQIKHVTFNARLNLKSISGINQRVYEFECSWNKEIPIDW